MIGMTFDLDKPGNMVSLLGRLRAIGLPATRLATGGGIDFVVVPARGPASRLVAVAGSNGAPCEVGLMFESEDGLSPYGSGILKPVASLEEAVSEIDRLVDMPRAGQ